MHVDQSTLLDVASTIFLSSDRGLEFHWQYLTDDFEVLPMRFSLKSLVVLVTFAGIGVSGFLQFSKIRQLHHETGKIQVELSSAINDDQRKLRSQEVLEPTLRSLQAEYSRVQGTRERVERIFQSLVAEFSKVVPKEDQISVRQVPTLNMEFGLKKDYVVYVPADRSCQLKINIESDLKQPRRISEDYLVPAMDSIPLAVGFNRVTFLFGQVEQRYKIQISVNDGQPLEIELVEPSSSGYGYATHGFSNQKDYDVGSKLPRLVKFKPSPCDHAIKLILVEQASVESGEQP